MAEDYRRVCLRHNLRVSLDCQVLILGGGPAGARTAELLARGGADVLLLEAEGPNVDNLCSGLLNAEGQAALGCHLPEHVRREPYTPQLEFHDADNRLRYRYSPGYWNMDRASFDAWLRERAAAAGAAVDYNRRASRIEPRGDHAMALVGGNEIRARVIIDATGWRALARRQLGDTSKAPHVHAFQGTVTSDLPEGSMWAVFRSAVTPYYGWLVPKGEGRFLLGAGFPQGAGQTRRTGAAAAVTDADPWGKLRYLLDYIEGFGAQLTPVDGHPLGCPITTISKVAQLWWGTGPVLPVGEAAGLVSPSSGDGIHFCLEHAAALSGALLRSGTLQNTSPIGEAEHAALTADVKGHLRAALGELRFNCVKAKVAANARTRAVAARLLPVYLRRPVERLKLPA
jgi:geranylgeranyl diphosphate/geranylgeranyl-bacteriochlorophyllide a reductase